MALKDDVLAGLARRANVAQFVSFAPEEGPLQRRSCVRGHAPDHVFPDLDHAVEALFEHSRDASVNVRSFHPDRPKGNAFDYGLRSADDVVVLLRRHAAAGLYAIVNETIDVGDGGVSGVTLGGVTEFAPDDTPRCVEKEGVCSLPHLLAMAALETVYGFVPEVDPKPDERTEFSIHPLRVGYRDTHTLLWEVERVEHVDLQPRLRWPNHFSRMVGDKAFGLLIADAVGQCVPQGTVVSRRVAPFRLGRPTGTQETWIRTCPREQQPGRFTTRRGWIDPFALLAAEDPAGDQIAAVLVQDGVDAAYSGATAPQRGGKDLVEGVAGSGDVFMQGEAPPEVLPPTVVGDVRDLVTEVGRQLGPVRVEWAHDGEAAWILQLHQVHDQLERGVIYPGQAERWHRFDVTAGLESLRRLIGDLDPQRDGVVVAGRVGLTSHVGDLLRKARIPARLENG